MSRSLGLCRLVCLVVWPVLQLTSPLQAQTSAPRRVALLVGVNEYLKPGFRTLSFAEADVLAVAEELKLLGFEATVLLGSYSGELQATRENIERTAQALATKLTKRDLMLVMLSGHGQQLSRPDAEGDHDRDEQYFCPVDAVVNQGPTQFALSHLLDDILAPNVGSKMVIVDACRDVPLDSSRGAKSSRGIEGAKVSLPEGTAIFFSCRSGQQSFEQHDLGHGLFTYCLLDGLRGAAVHDGVVAWSRLVDHVGRQMTDASLTKFMPPEQHQVPIPAGAMPYTVLGTSTHAAKAMSAPSAAQMLRAEDTAEPEALAEGLKHLLGIETRFDRQRARRFLQTAADAGNPIALSMLGDYDYYGYGRAINHEAGLALYRQAAAGLERLALQGNAVAQAQFGWMLLDGIGMTARPQQGLAWIEAAANQGHPIGQNLLGLCHLNGLAGPEDASQGILWYTKAAEAGLPDALEALGVAYRDGTGVDVDLDQARILLQRGADKNHPGCQTELALLHWDEAQTNADWEVVTDLLRRAADQDLAVAHGWLGNIYHDGLGRSANMREAAYRYVRAAALGDSGAFVNLGWQFVNETVPTLIVMKTALPEIEAAAPAARAKLCFERASEMGNDTAYAGLGVVYRDGLGVDADDAEAIRYFRLAADADDANGQLQLGEMILEGRGTVRDRQAGRGWIAKAAEQGLESAVERLQQLDGANTPPRENTRPKRARPGDHRTQSKSSSTDTDDLYQQAMLAFNGTAEQVIDRREAARLLTRSSEQGHALASARLAQLYYDGSGVVENREYARDLLIDVADSLEERQSDGDVEADLLLSVGVLMIVDDQTLTSNAIERLQALAESGNAEAMYYLGRVYGNVETEHYDITLAVDWLTRSAEGGCAIAELALGHAYNNGLLDNSGHKLTAQWYLAAANHGLGDGSANYGSLCHRGAGVQRDDGVFFRWTKQAADRGSPLGYWNLAYAYANGVGVDQDTDAAMVWYHRAAQAGWTDAYETLAAAYEAGQGVPVDPESARKWWRISADSGSEVGRTNYQRIIQSGIQLAAHNRSVTPIRVEGSNNAIVFTANRGNLVRGSFEVGADSQRHLIQIEADRQYQVRISGSGNRVDIPIDFEHQVTLTNDSVDTQVHWQP